MQRLRRTIGLPYPATRCSGVLSAEALAAAFPSRATVAGERASRSRRASPKEIPPVPGRHRCPWTRIAARPATSHGAPESDEHTALSGAARYAEARLGAA